MLRHDHKRIVKLVLSISLFIISSYTQSPVPCTINENCAEDHYCHTENCGSVGVCIETPIDCTKEYFPVCGCDGNTYGNNCTANAARVSIDYLGHCLSIPVCEECDDNFMALSHITNVLNNWQSGLSMNVRLIVQQNDLFLIIDLIDQFTCNSDEELTVRQSLHSNISIALPRIDPSNIQLVPTPDSAQCIYRLHIVSCTPSKPEVECLVDPCFRSAAEQCPDYPDAICVADYCGGCNALFFQNNNGILDRVMCLKSGGCPLVGNSSANCDTESTQSKCYSDYDCIDQDKCCTNECGGRSCVNAAPSKPGSCGIISLSQVGCVTECSNDFDCPGDAKCCSNGCGYQCQSTQGQTCTWGPCCDLTTNRVARVKICRPSNGRCDQPDICDGMSPYCPINRYLPKGSTCNLPNSNTKGICLGTHPDACMPGRRIPKYH